ncbi:MAG: hypothetical protein OEV08_08540 [Nitrospira sp.]|nr:hypothetical protein [Nitrospira sp.]
MVDQERKDSTPVEPMDDSYRAPWVIVGFLFSGIVLSGLAFVRLGINYRILSPYLFYSVWFLGPYVLLSVFLPVAWKSNTGRTVFGLAAVLIMLLSVYLVQVGEPSGGMSGLVILAIPFWQYVIAALAVGVIIILWSIDAWRHRHERLWLSQTSSFDHKLVNEMERAMESKETADLKIILSQAQARPDQYAEELVEAVRRLLNSRGEAPSS